MKKIIIKNELKGGIASAIVTFPIAVAFGEASGLGAMAGVYSAIIICLMGSILGGTPSQISSPVGVVLVAVIYIVNQHLELSANELALTPTSPQVFHHALPYIFMTFFIAGIIQVLLGFLRLGQYIHYLPYPVISGFSTGIGLLIILLQLKELFGLQGLTHRDFELLTEMSSQKLVGFEHAVFMVVATLLILIIVPRFIQSIPATLMALIIASLIPYILNWQNVDTIQALDGGIFQWDVRFLAPGLLTDRIMPSLIFALTLAIINSINTLLTSVAADHLTGTDHNSNRELIGQGIGNSLASLFGGMPGGGAIACTATNIHYGARTRWSGIVCAIVLFFTILFAGPYLGTIPVSVLNGILIYIGYLIIDKKAFRQITIMPWMDTVIMLIVIVLTTVGELVYAVIAGISLASIYFMKKMADTVELDTRAAKVDRLINNVIDSFDDAKNFRRQVTVKNIKGPIFFGFASRFSNSLKEMRGIKALVLNMGSVSYMDQSGLYTLEREIRKLLRKQVAVYIAEADKTIRVLMTRAGIIGDLIPHQNLFPSVEECVMRLNEPGGISGDILADLELIIPPAFTPNQDGINDVWMIRNIEKYPNCRVSVSTREGKRIFSSKGYKTPWDGRVKGEWVFPDKYRYEIELNDGKKRNIEGYVSVFR